MISMLLTCIAIVLGSMAADGPATDPPERAAYKSAAAAAGHDAAAHVRLALWCEAHGQTAERLEHLTQAARFQPTNVLAHGLLGLVRLQGQWVKPEEAKAKVKDDPARRAVIQEYLDRRAATPDTPQDQMKLAAWCEGKRLKEQAIVHYNAVIRLDPARADAWKHLGYRKQRNRWMKPDEVAAEKQDATRQKQADRRWRSKLEKLREDLQSKDAARRTRAEEAMAQVTDSRAVHSIWAVFAIGGTRLQVAAIQMFGQIDGASASNALAAMAIYSPRPEVRGRAIETLMRRDPRDVVGRLIDMVHKPYKYQVRPVQSPGSPGELFVEGERFNLQRFYQNQTFGMLLSTGAGRLFTPDVPFDPFSIQNLAMAMGTWLSNPLTVTSKGLAPSSTDPIAPEDVALAARAIASHPQNVQAILNQLVTNPNNRVVILPPGYTVPTDSSYSIPVHLVPVAGHQNSGPNGITGPPTGAMLAGMEAFARQVQAQKNNPTSPMGLAIQLGKIEANPQHPQDAAALGGMLQAQQMAAQRDLQLAGEIQAIRQANQVLQQQLAMDVRFIEWTNEGINLTNGRVLPVLKAITGLDLGTDREKWTTWWKEQLGYSSRPGRPVAKPTYQDQVTYARGGEVAISPSAEAGATIKEGGTGPAGSVSIRACFAAGTLVRTIEGPRPIQSIEVGDKVLCQDVSTGALEFQPVLATHRDEPASTFRITAGGESIVVTGLHRFWKAGKGWTMARDLKAGDRLRVLDGVVGIGLIEAAGAQPVYNLDVAENGDLFIGTGGLLVHDFGFVPAVPEPFDRLETPR